MCPVEEKAKIDICESDQWVAAFDSADFGLTRARGFDPVTWPAQYQRRPRTLVNTRVQAEAVVAVSGDDAAGLRAQQPGKDDRPTKCQLRHHVPRHQT